MQRMLMGMLCCILLFSHYVWGSNDAEAQLQNIKALAEQALPLYQVEAKIHSRQLANGLIVRQLDLPNKHTVTIASQFKVGSRNEMAGQTGYAHLFEHMLFKGSENAPGDSFSQQLNALGARFNASTDFDHTQYYMTLPSQALPLGLYLDADRFIRPALTQANIRNQQDTVLQEMAQTIDNQPYIRKAMAFLLSQVKDSPYGHAVIGSKVDIQSATQAELIAFHQQFYRPDQMQLAIVGNLSSQNDTTLDQHIDDVFGAWQNPTAPKPPSVDVAIVPRGAKGEIVDDRAPWPGILLAWHTVGASHPDAAAIALFQSYVFQNRGSLIAQAGLTNPDFLLNYSIPLTMQAHGVANLVLVPRARASLANLSDKVNTLISTVSEQGINDLTLYHLKQLWLSQRLLLLDDTQALAQTLSTTLAQDSAHPLTAPWERIHAVTVDDIQRVSQQYFAQDKLVRLDLLPPWYMRWLKNILEWLPQGISDSVEESVL